MIQSAVLYTNKLKAMRRFYSGSLGLQVIDQWDGHFTLQIGESHLTFKETDEPAFYHYAINIPGNQFSMMKFFLRERVEMNREEGRDEVYFPGFDADSMYFEDPAGNIVELIGRRKRDLFGDLSSASFLNISEIGLVTPDVTEVGEELLDRGLPLRKGGEIDPEGLNFIGSGDSYIVLVPAGRRWYFSKKDSVTYPLELVMDGLSVKVDSCGKHMD